MHITGDLLFGLFVGGVIGWFFGGVDELYRRRKESVLSAFRDYNEGVCSDEELLARLPKWEAEQVRTRWGRERTGDNKQEN